MSEDLHSDELATAEADAVDEFALDGLRLRFDDDVGELFADYLPTGTPLGLDGSGIARLIADAGYDDLRLIDGACDALAELLQGESEGSLKLAYAMDAEIELGLSADRFEVLLTTGEPAGGDPVTDERLRARLRDFGAPEELWLEEALTFAVLCGPVDGLVVAAGRKPKIGADGRLLMLIDVDSEPDRPKVDESGVVDHYQVRDFHIIEEGTPIARVVPPGAGEAGVDALGNVLPAVPGTAFAVSKDIPGVRFAEDDDGVLVADCKGHPVRMPDGEVRVDNVLTMDHADLRTGNVVFDGSVLINADVGAGVTVRATGDVVIKGSVENASVHGDCGVVVAGGVIGPKPDEDEEMLTLVTSGTDIEAVFISNARIDCAGDVIIKEYLSHCHTRAAGRVLAGQQGGKGLIIGGSCHAVLGIEANGLGTHANVPTRLSVGPDPELVDKRDAAREQVAGCTDRLARLRRVLRDLHRQHPRPDEAMKTTIAKAERTVARFERELAEANQALAELQPLFDRAGQSSVKVKGSVYPNVSVSIGRGRLTVRREGGGGRFVSRDGEVIWA